MDNKFTIPGAIVIAGVLIAGAILLTTNKGTESSSITTTKETDETAIAVREVNSQDHILGNPSADAIVIEFSDTECPFCVQFHTTMHTVMDNLGKDGKVAWVYRHFPIPQLHPNAPKEAEALECAAELGGNEKFWEYTDTIYRITPSNNGLDLAELPKIAKTIGLDTTQFQDCLESGKHAERVQRDYQDAMTAGGTGSPFSVIILKQKLSPASKNTLDSVASQLPNKLLIISSDQKRISISGALPYEIFSEILNVALTR
ncbi:MAG: thioredoxin domain-containing protein [Candidatus Pacebacteria bacterium]|nr:thioredoxin domain-containing protein [Candidatus Paceibacterota bacterium]